MPVEIPLSRGLVALVDPADFDRVRHDKWYAHASAGGFRYAATYMDGKRVFMHRMLVAATSGAVVDHVDGNSLNNVRANLRLCTQGQNLQNRRRQRGKSGFKGVCRHKNTGKFSAYIRANGSNVIHLGCFADAETAARARDAAARELHGAFAALNFPRPGERSALTGLIVAAEAA